MAVVGSNLQLAWAADGAGDPEDTLGARDESAGFIDEDGAIDPAIAQARRIRRQVWSVKQASTSQHDRSAGVA